MAEIKTISPTSYSTYDTCPYSWKMRYVYKLLLPDNENFIIGTALHRALELHHKAVPHADIITNIKTDLLTAPVDQAKINSVALVTKMYGAYLKYPLGGDTLHLEFEFRCALPTLDTPLHGIIDRVTVEGEVIDYKTASNDYASADANNIQAEIYSYAMAEILGKPVKVIFYVFNKSKINKPNYIPQVITLQPDTSSLLNKLTAFKQNINANNFKPKTGKQCLWCIFKKYCKYVNNTRPV